MCEWIHPRFRERDTDRRRRLSLSRSFSLSLPRALFFTLSRSFAGRRRGDDPISRSHARAPPFVCGKNHLSSSLFFSIKFFPLGFSFVIRPPLVTKRPKAVFGSRDGTVPLCLGRSLFRLTRTNPSSVARFSLSRSPFNSHLLPLCSENHEVNARGRSECTTHPSRARLSD